MHPDIDHVMVATTDLDATRLEFEALGFTVTPRARHLDFGTANHLCVLQDCYIELIGMDPDARPDATAYGPVAGAIAAGGGVPMIAIASDDAAGLSAAWRAAGFRTTDPLTWSRAADTPDGTVQARFTTFMMADDGPPGYVVFCCQQLTRRAIWCPPWMVHANGAVTLLGVRREWPASPPGLAHDYARLFGVDQVTTSGQRTGVQIGSRRLEFEGGHAVTRTILQLNRLPGTHADAGPAARPDTPQALRTVPGVSLEWAAG